MTTFKTRARAVEMLGRQQIAGIPTAISEIFKNAHDAYADNVEADFLRYDKLLVIRDDGIGMTRRDFEERWLALGTESKLEFPRESRSLARLTGKPQRAVLGEKGIGRLAMAVIGPQVLVLTRALSKGTPSKLVVAFVHWWMFQLPGIDIPTRPTSQKWSQKSSDVFESSSPRQIRHFFKKAWSCWKASMRTLKN